MPAVFYAATPAPPERELVRFADAVGRSTVPAADLVRSGTSFGSWEAALSTVALSAGDNTIVIVIDELPCLVDGRRELEAQLQHVWDQILEHRPVLLIAIGSDLAMMAALTSHGRPLFGRPTRALMRQHGVGAIWTADRDFRRFPDITARDPYRSDDDR